MIQSVNTNELPATTVMICLLFGTNAIFYLLFQLIKFYNTYGNQSSISNTVALLISNTTEAVTNSTSTVSSTSGDHKKDKAVVVVEKELSKPFDGSLDSFTNLTSELFRTSMILLLTYICENHWMFAHSGKEYSRDLFFFVLIIFFGYAWYTIKPVHDLTLLSREQTEEWKGWMQFIFLLYHYFHAEEVYNSVRVMITCYVWMTGFGNFSFFYMKQDFGWLRVVQMLWRLNFSVLLLMWTHGNTYILYYICPMHTFYFFMVYFTMYVYASINHTKYAIRVKLMILGLIIYIIWDINGGLFDILFGFLGAASVIGAKNGSVWEYYFRTSLDHWSAFLGMIFALNFPLAEQYFTKAKGWPLIICSSFMFLLFLYWCLEIYSKAKLDYNLTHSYTAIIPLTAYIFFRNLTPYIRSGVSMSLHDLGKTTLETYLLQHHIWLTSNAKTLLTIVPHHPWINFALATVLFFVVSKELYRLTMSLRGMLIPDDKRITINNCIGITVVLSLVYTLATVITTFHHVTFLTLFISSLVLFLATLLIITRFCRNMMDVSVVQIWVTRMTLGSIVVLILAMTILFFASPITTNNVYNSVNPSITGMSSDGSISTSTTATNNNNFIGHTPFCQNTVSQGYWISTKCGDNTDGSSGSSNNKNKNGVTAVTRKVTSTSNTGSSSSSSSNTAAETEAYCGVTQWKWSKNAINSNTTSTTVSTDNSISTTTSSTTSQCPPLLKISSSLARNIYSRKNIVFVGDSSIRNVYHQFNTLLDPSHYKYDDNNKNDNIMQSNSLKHANLQNAIILDATTSSNNVNNNSAVNTIKIQFLWAPYIENITTLFSNKIVPADMLIMGVGLWDTLNIHNLSHYSHQIHSLIHSPTLAALKASSVCMFLQPLQIQNFRLRTPEKQLYMNEEMVQKYRDVLYKSNKIIHYFEEKGLILNPLAACVNREQSTADGIHYTDEVYQVIVQMLSNAYLMRQPEMYKTFLSSSSKSKSGGGKSGAGSKQPYVPKVTGSMSFPLYGFLVLLLSAIMCFTMDNFLGLGWLSLVLTGRVYDWEAAYGPLIKIILRSSGGSVSSSFSSSAAAVSTHANVQGEGESDSCLDLSSNNTNNNSSSSNNTVTRNQRGNNIELGSAGNSSNRSF